MSTQPELIVEEFPARCNLLAPLRAKVDQAEAAALAALRGIKKLYFFGGNVPEDIARRNNKELCLLYGCIATELEYAHNRDGIFAEWLPVNLNAHISLLERLKSAVMKLMDAIIELHQAEAKECQG